jgi:serine O-acetyltransferase
MSVEARDEPKAETASVIPPTAALAEGWSDRSPDRPVPFWSSLRQDIVAHVPPEHRGRSTVGWVLLALKIVLTSPGFKVTFCYRLNHALSRYAGLPGRFAAGVINWVVRHLYFCSIAPRARLFGGLILPHPQGILIGSGVTVGPRVWIFHNVTLGGAAGKDGEPTVGADVRIRCGAVVCGPCVIGDEAEICPNSFVQRNVPTRSLAVGVPANVFPRFARPER